MSQAYLLVLLTISPSALYPVPSFTDDLSKDTALNDLYKEPNCPQQLFGRNSNAGDPFEELWKGISYLGSSVMVIQINGLELSGCLGDQLSYPVHLKKLFGDSSFNDFSGNIPSSSTLMKYLHHMITSHISLSRPVGNVLFTYLRNLKQTDLSNNNYTEDLPTSLQEQEQEQQQQQQEPNQEQDQEEEEEEEEKEEEEENEEKEEGEGEEEEEEKEEEEEEEEKGEEEEEGEGEEEDLPTSLQEQEQQQQQQEEEWYEYEDNNYYGYYDAYFMRGSDTRKEKKIERFMKGKRRGRKSNK